MVSLELCELCARSWFSHLRPDPQEALAWTGLLHEGGSGEVFLFLHLELGALGQGGG